jgi:HPt (histidine-containing phosphotransfer) domain-containing protein
MDLQIPIMSGYEAATIIRNHNKEIPIVALTAAAMVEDREKVLSVGMNDHLSKPINSSEMIQTVAKWCNRSIKLQDKKIETRSDATLDVEHILDIVNGNRNLMLKIYSKFLTELENEFKPLPQLLSQNDPKAASLIHALKGVSGNVGAKALAYICTTIDANQKKGLEISHKEIETLQNSMDELVAEIQSIELNSTIKLQTITLSKDETTELFTKTIENIKIGTMITSKDQDLLLSQLKNRVNSYELSLWMDAMDEFDYDKAYNIMKEWKI